jgi:hypothetical protein
VSSLFIPPRIRWQPFAAQVATAGSSCGEFTEFNLSAHFLDLRDRALLSFCCCANSAFS